MHELERQAEPATLLGRQAVLRTPPGAAAIPKYTLVCRWWVAFLSATVLVVSGHLLIKAAVNTTASAALGASFSARLARILAQPLTWEGLLIYAFGTVCWMVAVAQKDLSYLYPLSSVNYVVIVLTSAVLFQEWVSLRRCTGVALVVLGLVLMHRGESRGANEPETPDLGKRAAQWDCADLP